MSLVISLQHCAVEAVFRHQRWSALMLQHVNSYANDLCRDADTAAQFTAESRSEEDAEWTAGGGTSWQAAC